MNKEHLNQAGPLSFDEEGQEPEKRMYGKTTEQHVFPRDMAPTTQNLLRDGFETGAFDDLSPIKQELIAHYFGTEDAFLQNLAHSRGVSLTTVRFHIQSGLHQIWSHLPTDLQEKYALEEIDRLKPRGARKGSTLNQTTRDRISESRSLIMTDELKRRIGKTRRDRMTEGERQKNRATILKAISQGKVKPFDSESAAAARAKVKNPTRPPGHVHKRAEAQAYYYLGLGRKPRISSEERISNPFMGAVHNFDAVRRREAEQNGPIFVIPPEVSEAFKIPYIVKNGKIWLVTTDKNNVTRQELTIKTLADLYRNNNRLITIFGNLPLEQIMQYMDSQRD